MKNFIVLCLQLGVFAFGIAAVFAVINYLTGWHLGFKGADVPGDPVAALAFLVLAGLCAGGSYLMTRKK